MKILKEVHVFADSDPQAKTEACQELVDAVMVKIEERDVAPHVLEQLVTCAVHMVCMEAYTRDAVAAQASAKIFREWCLDFSEVLGISVELLSHEANGKLN